MNAAAKELPVSYDLSKPQEDKEPYVGSVLFFKHVIFTVTLLLILIPTTLSIYLFAQVRSLNRQLDAAGSQLAAMQEQLSSTAPEGGDWAEDGMQSYTCPSGRARASGGRGPRLHGALPRAVRRRFAARHRGRGQRRLPDL